MDHNAKLKFILALHKHSLAAMATGGLLPGLTNALTVTNGYQAASPTDAGTIGGQQSTLAGELQNEAAGNGPNPAQIQYNRNAQNIAQQQASSYAANRSLNPGLAARMAGNTATNAQLNAASGAAQQQAEQQLASQQLMEGLTGQEQEGLGNAQGINAQVAQNNANAQNQTGGGLISGIGSAIGSIFAEGGKVKKMASGGSIEMPNVPSFSNAYALNGDHSQASKAGSSVGKWLHGQMFPGIAGTTASGPALAGAGEGASMAPSMAGAATMMAARGGKMASSKLMKSGGNVHAGGRDEKAVKKGDSYSNDKIPALLSEGEVVIDRDTLNQKGTVGQMARAVAKYIQQRNSKSKKA